MIQIPSAQSWVIFVVLFLFPSWDSKFSVGERLGLQAGQLSTQTLLLWSHAVLIDAVCCLALCFLNMEDLPWKRCHLDGGIRCSKVFICLPAQMVPFQNVCRQFHRHECRPLTIRLFYWWSLSSLVWRMRHPCFPKRIKELKNYRTVFHFPSVYFKLAQRR